MIPRHPAEFIHSKDNIAYSEWEKRYAWLPIKTIGKRWVWLTTVYRRQRRAMFDIPQLRVQALNRVEWATLEEIFERRLKDLP